MVDTSSLGKRNQFRQDWDVKTMMNMHNMGILEQVKRAIAAGYRVTACYAPSIAATPSHPYCTCPLGRRTDHKSAGHPCNPGSSTAAASVVESWLRELGAAIIVKAVDRDGNLHELDAVLESSYTPSALFAPLLAREKRLAAEAAGQRQEAISSK